MSFIDLFKQKFKFVGIDIGGSSAKFIELKERSGGYNVVQLGTCALPKDVVQNNTISQPSVVADALKSAGADFDPKVYRGVFAVPAPSVFTKRHKVNQTNIKELADTIQFEAASLIPHSINAVRLDFHVLGEAGKNQLEILVVAVKNDVIDRFVETVTVTGIEPGICDVEYFAVQNAFEANYPEYLEKTVALVEIGSKYSAVNLINKGQSLFCGDVNIGGDYITQSLTDVFGMSEEEAEKLKQMEMVGDERLREAALDILAKNVEHVASELHRQLTFFCSAADTGVDCVVLSGGAAHTRGLIEAFSERSEVETFIIDPFKNVTYKEKEKLKAPAAYSVSVGLALRSFGDKVYD